LLTFFRRCCSTVVHTSVSEGCDLSEVLTSLVAVTRVDSSRCGSTDGQSRFIRNPIMEGALEELLASWGSGAERDFQELVSSSSFHILLVQKVKEQILIPLNQPLRVDLSMFELLISVSLDSFEESTECLLLLLP